MINRSSPGLGELLLACSDALIAAQTAVIAAESRGIGSCYIGDVLENGEIHAELLALPAYTLPVAMVCFGRPLTKQQPIEHFGGHLVHRDRYQRLEASELAETAADLERLHAPHGLPPGVTSYPQVVYRRKFTPSYMEEMNRMSILVEKEVSDFEATGFHQRRFGKFKLSDYRGTWAHQEGPPRTCGPSCDRDASSLPDGLG